MGSWPLQYSPPPLVTNRKNCNTVIFTFLYFSQDTNSSARSAVRILQTFVCYTARSSVDGAVISSHCLLHLRPWRWKPSIGSSSVLTALSQVFTCHLHIFFQWLKGLQFNAFFVRALFGLRRTWPNHLGGVFFIIIINEPMSFFLRQRIHNSALLTIDVNDSDRQEWSNTLRAWTSAAFRDQVGVSTVAPCLKHYYAKIFCQYCLGHKRRHWSLCW